MKGFTLIELLVVMGIIGILAFISFSVFRNFQPVLQLRGMTRELISDIRYIQQLSITEQKEYCLQFFPIERKYQIIQCEASEPLEEKLFPKEIKTITVIGFTDNKVRYNPYGAAAETGSIVLENSSNETKTILVKISGFVKISD